MKKTDIKSPLLLFLAAFIWGVAFVAQGRLQDCCCGAVYF